jgi:hypothetical protein
MHRWRTWVRQPHPWRALPPQLLPPRVVPAPGSPLQVEVSNFCLEEHPTKKNKTCVAVHIGPESSLSTAGSLGRCLSWQALLTDCEM